MFWVDNYAYDEIMPGAGFFIAATLLAAILAFNLPVRVLPPVVGNQGTTRTVDCDQYFCSGVRF